MADQLTRMLARLKAIKSETLMDDDMWEPWVTLPPESVSWDSDWAPKRLRFQQTEDDSDQLPAALRLMTLHDEYLQSGNSTFALLAFVVAIDHDLYPPRWTLVWLHEAFYQFVTSQNLGKGRGRLSLDHFLGLKLGRGRRNVIRQAASRTFKDEVMLMMWELDAAFGARLSSVEEIAGMVNARLAEDHARPVYDPDTLKTDYYHCRKELRDLLADMVPTYSTPQYREHLLGLYPDDAIPSGLK